MLSNHELTLRIPLYKLYYLDAITDNPFTQQQLASLYTDYSRETIQEIVSALEWATENPQYPFASLLPNIPFSDGQAHQYLANVLRQINESRPPRE